MTSHFFKQVTLLCFGVNTVLVYNDITCTIIYEIFVESA